MIRTGIFSRIFCFAPALFILFVAYPVCKTPKQFMLSTSAYYAIFFHIGIHYCRLSSNVYYTIQVQIHDNRVSA